VTKLRRWLVAKVKWMIDRDVRFEICLVSRVQMRSTSKSILRRWQQPPFQRIPGTVAGGGKAGGVWNSSPPFSAEFENGLNVSTPSHTLVTSLFYKQECKSYPLLVVVCKSVSSDGDPTCRKEHPCLMHGTYRD